MSPPSALAYMALKPGTAIEDIALDRVFIGSCTNSRIEDLRAAAEVVRGRQVASSVHAMVVPGSMQVKAQAEQEGLDEVFKAAGFEWREAGCSMCLGMNPDILQPGERCASTSNRNFEGRQGQGRPHAPREPADGGRGGCRGAFRGRPGVEPVSGKPGGVWQQEDVVTGFIDDRRKLIPLFDVQEDLVRRLMTRGGRQVTRFCDLGAGDGGFGGAS